MMDSSPSILISILPQVAEIKYAWEIHIEIIIYRLFDTFYISIPSISEISYVDWFFLILVFFLHSSELQILAD